MPETTTPIIPDGPGGVPHTTEPETGYITRGLVTYAVDYADMTVAQALDLGVIVPAIWRSLDGVNVRVWSARIDKGPVAYGPTKEAAIHAVKGPTRKGYTTLEFLLTQGPPTLTWDRMGFLVGVDPARGADKSVVVVNERHKDHERKALRALAMRDIADFQRKTGTTVHNASLDMISSWVLAVGKTEDLRELIAEIEKAEQPKVEENPPSSSWWPIGGFPSLLRMSSLGRALLDAESVGETGHRAPIFHPSDMEEKALRAMAERYPEEVTKHYGQPGPVPLRIVGAWLYGNKARWEEYCVALNDLRRAREGQRPRRIRVVGTTLLGGAQPGPRAEEVAQRLRELLLTNHRVVVTDGWPEGVIPGLVASWANHHDVSRVIISGKLPQLRRFFNAELANHPQIAVSRTGLVGAVLTGCADIYGVVADPQTPVEHLAGFGGKNILWLSLSPPTSEQVNAILGTMPGEARVVFFGTEDERVKLWGPAWKDDPRFQFTFRGSAISSKDAESAPVPTGLKSIVESIGGIRGEREARAHKILTALKGNTKVVTAAGNDDLYAALAVGWAEQHPTGRVIVAAKRKDLARIFAGDLSRGEAALQATGRCRITVTSSVDMEDVLRIKSPRYEGQVLPHHTPIYGFRLRESTSRDHIAAVSGPDHPLWIVTRPITPEQLTALIDHTTRGARVVLFDPQPPEVDVSLDPAAWIVLP